MSLAPPARLPVLEDLPDPAGRRVLVRADLNVPLAPGPGGELAVADDFRIEAALPTLRWLIRHGAKPTVCSHLGRPGGHLDERYEMAPVRRRLSQLLKGVEVMENLRFEPGEERNDPEFVRRLVDGFELYVDDAFAVAHRSHASVVGPPKLLPSAAGRLVEREVEALGRLLDQPDRPFYLVVGGAKVADKLGVLHALAHKVEATIVGGGMCFTFLVALGHHVGNSLVDAEQLEACRALLDSGRRIVLPTDLWAISPDASYDPGAGSGVGTGSGRGADSAGSGEIRCFGRDLPDGWTGLDIGPESAASFAEELRGSGTVLWNGPMGRFEDERFAAGTRAVAQAVAESSGFTVVGGGDTAEAVRAWGLFDRIDHVSTGGGATLQFIETGDLPGLAALRASISRPVT